ncbi:hypothetical protein ABZ079_20865 [Streptomyces sp. NPDC006314]|uniref:hypothetical protein n=1 Tax=Streptomyces sp. NPDC006314 TaxID=3154475 RepID=UPI00339FE5BD
MPEETAPTDTATTAATAPTGTARAGAALVRGVLGCGCAVFVGLLVLIVTLVCNAWGSTDFPRVPREDMAGRVFQRSQEAYDVLGFRRTIEPGVERVGVSTDNTFGSGLCYDGGLLGLEDKTVDGAYRMDHNWALDHVPASVAVSGLRRLHRQLQDEGWEVTSYREGEAGEDWDLFVQRDGGDERMSFTWFPEREYFIGGAAGPCAYDPEWKDGDVDSYESQEHPPALAPSSRG